MARGITVVGLGPGGAGHLTTEARDVLGSASEIYLRTRVHPTVSALPEGAKIVSFDDVYEQADEFSEVYDTIAQRVVELGTREQGVVYAVPGHPLVGESSVQRILRLAEGLGLAVRIVEGVSFVDVVCTTLGLDPLDGIQIGDATAVAGTCYPAFSTCLPLILGQLYSRQVASDVKLVLLMAYPGEHRVTVLRAAGTEGQASQTLPLHELDRVVEIDHLTALYVPPIPAPSALSELQEVVARLRAPGGCPWDREQTHRSLRPFLLEETYEVLRALDADDTVALTEELGDLLLQIMLHTQVGIEEAEFLMADVVGHIVAKLMRRHPHVFGQVQVNGSQEVLVNWERIKAEENRHRPEGGLFVGIPTTLPALEQAQTVQHRSERRGRQGPRQDLLESRIQGRLKDLAGATSLEERERALGRLLFDVTELARILEVDAESALRQSTAEFASRVEETLRAGRTLGWSDSDADAVGSSTGD